MSKSLRFLLGLGCFMLLSPWISGCSTSERSPQERPLPREVSAHEERATPPIRGAEWEELLGNLKQGPADHAADHCRRTTVGGPQ